MQPRIHKSILAATSSFYKLNANIPSKQAATNQNRPVYFSSAMLSQPKKRIDGCEGWEYGSSQTACVASPDHFRCLRMIPMRVCCHRRRTAVADKFSKEPVFQPKSLSICGQIMPAFCALPAIRFRSWLQSHSGLCSSPREAEE